MFSYRLERLIFSGGETVNLNASGVLILVGPNNSGKSRALRDIKELWKGDAPQDSIQVITSADFSYTEDWDTFISWAGENYKVQSWQKGRPRYVGNSTVRVLGINAELAYDRNTVPATWTVFEEARGLVMSMLDTESRLLLSRPAERIDAYEEGAKHFVHMLQTDSALLKRVQNEVKAAFGVDLALDFAGGTKIYLLLGDLPLMQPEWDRVSPEYARLQRKQMVPLHEAGDGVRSYVATLAASLAEPQPVLLIDEPEAFLHPPQARRLGKFLADIAAERSRQIVLATHSSDIVRGALSSSAHVGVCRLQRNRDRPDVSTNHAFVLESTELRALWEKPLLRSSHAIDGIFHRGVYTDPLT